MARLGPVLCVALLAMSACARKTATSTPPPTAASPSARAPFTPPSHTPSPAASLPVLAPSPPPAPPPSPGTTPPPAGAAAQSITFISLQQAWVLAKAAGGQVVLHTSNRGLNWSRVGTLPPAAGVSELRFGDALDGWAFGPNLYATHDGGATWGLVSLPGQVIDVEASGGTAYALDQPCPQTAASCLLPQVLERSPVSANAWQAVPGTTLSPGAGGTVAPHGSALYLLSGTLLFASAGGALAGLPGPCPSGFVPGGLAVSSATDIAALCAGEAGAGSSTKQVFVSTDSGHTYRALPDAPRSGQTVGFAAASPTTIALAAASGASWIYRTAGAGTTWSTPLSFPDGGAGWADLGFTDATHGVVVYAPQQNGKIYLTSDAGASWTEVPLSP